MWNVSHSKERTRQWGPWDRKNMVCFRKNYPRLCCRWCTNNWVKTHRATNQIIWMKAIHFFGDTIFDAIVLLMISFFLSLLNVNIIMISAVQCSADIMQIYLSRIPQYGLFALVSFFLQLSFHLHFLWIRFFRYFFLQFLVKNSCWIYDLVLTLH